MHEPRGDLIDDVHLQLVGMNGDSTSMHTVLAGVPSRSA
jgi:hypothetical protein